MKRQVTSILLCALLSTTIAHEYLTAQHFAHEARLSKLASPLSHFQERAASSEVCEWVCEGSNNTSGLQLIINETTSLVGIVNVTANVALILDINANLVGLFNGSSGVAIVVNIQTGSGVYIAAGQSTSVWLIANESFEIYFSRLTSLQIFLNLQVGATFTISSISVATLQIIGNILIKLSAQIQQELSGNIRIALNILLRIGSSYIVLLRGSLGGLLRLAGRGLIVLYGDLSWLLNVFEGLAIFFGEVNGGLAALIKAGVQLDLVLLLRATNGLELLVNLLLAVVARVNLSIVGGLLNSTERFLELIVKLGGNVSSGANGVLRIVYQIVAVIYGRIQLEFLIQTLLEYAASGGGSFDLSIYIEGLSRVIDIQRSLHSTSGLSGFLLLVQNLQRGNLIISGIDISEIITILVRGAGNRALELVVTILLRLSGVIKAEVALPRLLLHLLVLLNSTAGIELLQQAIPDLRINISVSGNGNISAEILRGISVQTITRIIARGNVNNLLKALPVISAIYTALSSAIQVSSKGSRSLSIILTSSDSSSTVAQINVWIKSALHIGGPSLPPIRYPPVWGPGPVVIHGGENQSTTRSSGGSWRFGFDRGHHEHPVHSGHKNNEESSERHHKTHHS